MSQVLGNYELLKKVGQGAMGAVYRARQITMDRIVALKILPPDLAKDKAFVQRFLREARSAGKCHHPNLIPVDDVGQVKNYYYYAMEFVAGRDLKEVLKQDGPLDEATAIEYMIKIAGALRAAHSSGIVHRDVKPDNIMLTEQGEPKLADLGLAKPMSGDADVTMGGQAVGTPHYMAPEQVRGEEADGRTDLYGLGATFWHLLAGETLYAAATAAHIMSKHANEPPRPLREVRKDASPELESVLNKLLQKSAGARYANTDQLIEDLEAVARGDRPMHVRMSAGGRMRTTSKQRPVGSRPSRRMRGARREDDAPQPQPAKSQTGLIVAGAAVGVALLAVAAFVMSSGGKKTHTRKKKPAKTASKATPQEKKPDASSGKTAPESTADGPKVDELLASCRQKLKDNPDDLASPVGDLESALRTATAPADRQKLEDEIKRIRISWTTKATEALAAHDQSAKEKLATGNFDAALAEFDAIPAGLRQPIMEKWTAARAAVVKQATDQLEAGVDAVAAHLAAGRIEEAREALKATKAITYTNEDLADKRAELAKKLETATASKEADAAQEASERVEKALGEFFDKIKAGDSVGAGETVARVAKTTTGKGADTLNAAARVAGLFDLRDKKLREAIKALEGKRAAIRTTKGPRRGVVQKVGTDGFVVATDIIINGVKKGTTDYPIKWGRLSREELKARVRDWPPDTPEGHAALTLKAIVDGDVESATQGLAKIGEMPLASWLQRRLKVLREGAAEVAAEDGWKKSLEPWFGRATLSKKDGAELEKTVATYRDAHGKSKFAQGKSADLAALNKRAQRAQMINLVANPGFEANDLNPWKIRRKPGHWRVEKATEKGHTGQPTSVLLIQGYGDGGSQIWVDQELLLEKNQDYVASFRAWYRATDRDFSQPAKSFNKRGIIIRAVLNAPDMSGGEAQHVTVYPFKSLEEGWITVQGRFTASTEKLWLRIGFECGGSRGARILIDDVCVARAPEIKAAGPNVIVNGDFESGHVAPWKGSWRGSEQIVSEGAHGGKHAVEMRKGRFLRQTVRVAVGEHYQVSCWVRAMGPKLSARGFLDQWNGRQIIGQLRSRAATKWMKWTYRFKATKESYTLGFMQDGHAELQVDDIQFFPIRGEAATPRTVDAPPKETMEQQPVKEGTPAKAPAIAAGDAQTEALTRVFDKLDRGDIQGAAAEAKQQAGKAEEKHRSAWRAAEAIVQLYASRVETARKKVKGMIGKNGTFMTVKGIRRRGVVKAEDEKGFSVDTQIIINGKVVGATTNRIAWGDLSEGSFKQLAPDWPPKSPDGHIVRALVALKAMDAASAEKHLASAGEHALANFIRYRIDVIRRGAAEVAAEKGFAELSKRYAGRKLDIETARKGCDELNAYCTQHGSAKWFEANRKKIDALRNELAAGAELNYIDNGGFERAPGPEWQMPAGARVEGKGFDGSTGVGLGLNQSLTQKISAPKGQWVVLRYRWFMDEDPLGAAVEIKDGDKLVGTLLYGRPNYAGTMDGSGWKGVFVPNKWLRKKLIFRVPSENTLLTFKGMKRVHDHVKKEGSKVWIDNVSCKPWSARPQAFMAKAVEMAGRRYRLSRAFVSGRDAEAFAKALGGKLVAFETRDEWTAFKGNKKLFGAHVQGWCALRVAKGKPSWPGGSEFVFSAEEFRAKHDPTGLCLAGWGPPYLKYMDNRRFFRPYIEWGE